MLLSSGLSFLFIANMRLNRIKMDRVYCTKDEAQEESRGYTREKGDNSKRLRPTICFILCKRGCCKFCLILDTLFVQPPIPLD